ncbi:MAG: DUF3489 domain-containing protein [Alteraurantiacibacter sp.]
MTQTITRKPRRMAREKQPQAGTPRPAQETSPASGEDPAPAAKSPSRLDQLQTLLAREEGASIAEMVDATGWQQHSVRGAMAGALKKRGHTITSEKIDGTRRYRAEVAA